MDYDKVKDVLGVFWSFTTLFIIVSFINLLIVLYYTTCCCRWKHIKAKGPINLLIIFVAGQMQSWGHYFYSLPVYRNETDDIVACLFMGYCLQHLFGTTLLFYALVSRLVKYGLTFKSFDCWGKSPEASTSWTQNIYTSRIKIRYKVALGVTFLFVLAPMVVFIIGAYNWHSIQVNDDNYCVTNEKWKIAFVVINTIYFLALSVMACFVPRNIEHQFFNEASAIIHSVIYSTAVFVVEIWISFGNQYYSLAWAMLSNGLTFSIHTFVIWRIFGYRFVKGMMNDNKYERAFLEVGKIIEDESEYFNDIVLNANHNSVMLNAFFTYLEIVCRHESIEIPPHIGDKSQNFNVPDVVHFCRKTLEFKAKMSSLNISGEYVEKAFKEFTEIREKYIEGCLDLSPPEREYFKGITIETVVGTVFHKHTLMFLNALYQRYFKNYVRTESAGKTLKKIRNKQEIGIGMNTLVGDLSRDQSDFEIYEIGKKKILLVDLPH